MIHSSKAMVPRASGKDIRHVILSTVTEHREASSKWTHPTHQTSQSSNRICLENRVYNVKENPNSHSTDEIYVLSFQHRRRSRAGHG